MQKETDDKQQTAAPAGLPMGSAGAAVALSAFSGFISQNVNHCKGGSPPGFRHLLHNLNGLVCLKLNLHTALLPFPIKFLRLKFLKPFFQTQFTWLLLLFDLTLQLFFYPAFCFDMFYQ